MRMNDKQEQACVDASIIVRLGWTIAEKSVENGAVAEHDLVELERLVRMSLNVPDEHSIDIA